MDPVTLAAVQLGRCDVFARVRRVDTRQGQRGPYALLDLGDATGELRAIDFELLTVSLGVELGGAWITQSFDDEATSRRSSFGARMGPIVTAERHFGAMVLRGELGIPLYLLRVADGEGGAKLAGRLVPTGGLGIGLSF